MPGVQALHVRGGVRLGVAQGLGLPEGLTVAQTQAGHGVENIVAGAVHDAPYVGDGLNAPGPFQLAEPADAPAYRGGTAQAHPFFPGQGDQLVIAGGDQGLVGGGHVFPRQNGPANIVIGRMYPAHGLHHRIDGGVTENVLKSMGDPGIRQL